MSSLSLPGAVAAVDPRDTGVAGHYGSPLAEQRRLASGEATVDLSHLGVVTISGPDRLSWLHDLVTAHVRDLSPGESRLALLLDHNGRIEHELHLVDDGETAWLIVEPDAVAPIVSYLDSMRFMLRVEVADRSPDFAVVGRTDTSSVAGSEQPNLVTWRVPPEFRGVGVTEAGADAGGDAAKYVGLRPDKFAVDQIVVPRGELDRVLTGAEHLAGTWAWEAQRVGAGVPRVAVDGDAKVLPHELGLIGAAVHLDKGCYRGQETVARVHNMGRPPRRLVQLLFASSEDLPEPGADITLAERRVGRLGSVVQHVDFGPVGLALVKRNVPLDGLLNVGGQESQQVEIVIRG